MNNNDSNQIKHYTEAERLLVEADDLVKQISKRPGDGQREILDARLTHVEQRAIGHALLAGIVLPDRIETS